MAAYIAKRLLGVGLVLIGASLLVFLLIRAVPGDPALLMAGDYATENEIAALRQRYALDRPLPVQYAMWLKAAVRGDLGRSIRTKSTVLSDIAAKLPATLELTLASLAFAFPVGLALGIAAALRRGSIIDSACITVTLLGTAVPAFFLGVVLMYVFAATLRILPLAGRLPPGYSLHPITGLLTLDSLLRGDLFAFKEALRHLVLPALTLAVQPVAMVSRVMRSALLEVLGQDYLRTARSKGLRERAVIFKHAVRNAVLPVVTVMGLTLAGLMTGAVVTETVFAWPGLGRYIVEAVLARDFPVVQGTVVFAAAVFALANLLIDVSYSFIDPRVRVGGKR